MSEVRVLLMSAPSAEVADRIVDTLVAEQLIACGSITTPVASIYRWQGTIERAAEVLVIMKTTAAAAPAASARIAGLHPYDVPEILMLPVLGGHDPYLDWVRESVVVSRNAKE